MLKNVRLSVKLYGGFIVVLVIMSLVATVGYIGLKRTINAMGEIVDNVDIAKKAGTVLTAAQDAQAHSLRYVIYKDGKYELMQDGQVKNIISIAGEIEKTVSSDEIVAHAKLIESGMVDYDKLFKEFVVLENTKSQAEQACDKMTSTVIDDMVSVIKVAKDFTFNTNKDNMVDKGAVERTLFLYSCLQSIYELNDISQKYKLTLNSSMKAEQAKSWVKQVKSVREMLIKSKDMMASDKTKEAIQSSLDSLATYEEQIVVYLDCCDTQMREQLKQKEQATVVMNTTKAVTEEVYGYVDQLVEDSDKVVQNASMMIVVSSGIAVAIGMLIAFVLTNGIVKPINRIISSLSSGSEQVTEAAEQVSTTSQSLARGATEQAAGLEESSSSLEEMASMTKKSADNAKEASELAIAANTAAENGIVEMTKMNEAIEDIQKASDETAKIIKVIDEIAFQTNLLALNAAVEAARAGEAGKGFAVVAEEVRNLAMRSAEAAKDTAAMIEGAVKYSRTGVEIASQVSSVLDEIVSSISNTSRLVNDIAASSQEQATGIGQISTAISQIDQITQENSANAEESASASEELSAQACQMNQIVGELNSVVSGVSMTVSSKGNNLNKVDRLYHKIASSESDKHDDFSFDVPANNDFAGFNS